MLFFVLFDIFEGVSKRWGDDFVEWETNIPQNT